MRRELLEGDAEMQCPNCHKELGPDALIVNKEIRKDVDSYLHETTGTAKKPEPILTPVSNI